MTAPTTPCAECGMPCTPGEFHPYAACLMFKACHDSETVRANLAALAAPAEPPKPVGWPQHVRDAHAALLQLGAKVLHHRTWGDWMDEAASAKLDEAMSEIAIAARTAADKLASAASPTVTIDGPEAARGDGGEG